MGIAREKCFLANSSPICDGLVGDFSFMNVSLIDEELARKTFSL